MKSPYPSQPDSLLISPSWNNWNPSANEQSIEGAQLILVISDVEESFDVSESPSSEVYTVIV